MKRFKTVEEYIESSDAWQPELERLREVLCSTDLEEDVKWGAPCYTWAGKNVVGMLAFKGHFGLWFHQGALLDDPEEVLINAQEGKTKAQRQWRMTSGKEIKARTIKAYVKQAIAVVDEGKEIKPTRDKPVVVPSPLKAALAKNKRAGTAFAKLTKGRQREYADYVSDAKRDATKETRLKKILPMIAAGQGLNDKYRNC
jgi:uncharacterized protein YdeI (YjbR/CyaY-like superfamily)